MVTVSHGVPVFSPAYADTKVYCSVTEERVYCARMRETWSDLLYAERPKIRQPITKHFPDDELCMRERLTFVNNNIAFCAPRKFRQCQIFKIACWRRESSTVMHHIIWARSPPLLMSLVDRCCILSEPIDWLYLQLDCPPSAAELFRLPPLKSGTLYRNTVTEEL